ncbi:CYFA0S01e05006g1_1 [Cyberlindnera fabianii]|uniref:CYFA0S01e05006g1_1 n=1 Tax=Cyberlindnera fabianii TaxID=36022 RepID=A0A061AH02_CYBFA|nr:CYFA0S01e05006g1_1 [Cyberlindnera fabianii]
MSRASSEAIAPKVEQTKNKKSRLVPPESRRRAAYSCDRCKAKKIKCERVVQDGPSLHDRTHPCSNCNKYNLQCITTVPRRRRVYASFENLGTHYQTVIQLVQGLYPDVDINDVNALTHLGQSLGINMNMENDNDDLKNIEVESKILKPFSPNAIEFHSASSHGSGTPNNHSEKRHPLEPYEEKSQETVVYDATGGTHYVGSSGTSSLFTLLCNLLLKRSLVSTLSFDNNITLFRNGLERKPNYKEIYTSFLENPNFPLIRIVPTRQKAMELVDVFFKKVHPFYFVFDQTDFMVRHDLYWKLLESGESVKQPRKELPDTAIGCIYLVYLLGTKMTDINSHAFDSTNIDEIFQLILTDATLGASISSIQFLYLYATYLHSEKNRESCWNLIGLAIRQATSLGLHRSMGQGHELNIQSQLFWSLFQTEMTLCLNFGRQSIINEAEVDIPYPDLSRTNLTPEFIHYHKANLQMSRFLSKVVKDRRFTQQPLSLLNIERTLSLKAQLNKLHEELQIKPLAKVFNIYDLKLCLTYHNYLASITLPILVYVTTTNFKIREDETIMSIVRFGVQAAVTIAKAMNFAVGKDQFHNGAVATDCLMGYNSALFLSLFFIYLCNTSNDLWEIEIEYEGEGEVEVESVDKTRALEYISQIAGFMERSKLDPTTMRIAEVIEGLRNDLNVVALQEDVKFESLNFEGQDQLVYDSLVFNNDIYLDSWF